MLGIVDEKLSADGAGDPTLKTAATRVPAFPLC